MKAKIVKIIKQFVRFGLVGGTCFGIDYILMVLLTEIAGCNYLLSSGISFSVATVINYFLSVRFVFKHDGGKHYDILIFVIMSFIGLLLNTGLMWTFVEKIHINYLIAKIIAGILVSFYNFVTRKFYLERNSK